MRKTLVFCLLLGAMVLMAPLAARAQGSIAGSVRDTSGAVLPGVTVEASSDALIEKTRSAVTDSSGNYRIVDLPPGTYTATFTLTGFKTVRREGILIQGTFSAPVSEQLQVGTLEETITVTGTPTVDVSNNTAGWDTATVRDSLNVLSETIDQTYPHLSAALDGVARFSDTIGKRDDQIKQLLANASVNYDTVAATGTARVRIGEQEFESFDARGLAAADQAARTAALRGQLEGALNAAGCPHAADPAAIDRPIVVLLLAVLVAYVGLVYGPIAAMLVEMFPTRIRYSAMSLPYHLGNGWFGGLLPPIAFAIVAQTGNIYSGLWYPVAVAAATFVIGLFFVRDAAGRNLDEMD